MITSEVNARLDSAVAAHSPIATRHTWDPGHEGKSAGYVRIAATTPASPDPRWSVLITGGTHARELAPPDALVSFVERLLVAYAAGTGVSYPAFRSTDGVVFDPFTVTAGEVRVVVERLNLVVAPLVNADGRDFVLTPPPPGASTDEVNRRVGWRKNRWPNPASNNPDADGVDINRNFDIMWDFEKHYAPHVGVRTSTNPISEIFCGDKDEGPASQPETKNLVKLFDEEHISYYLDVHSFDRSILFSWGIETNQIVNPGMSFMNKDFDGRRDGRVFNAYREYITDAALLNARTMATKMTQDILARAGGTDTVARLRSTYKAKPASELDVTSGAADDYCFSRWFRRAADGRPIPMVVAMTMEAGADKSLAQDPSEEDLFDDGGFQPHFTTQFPKVEREIHAAVWSFLTQVAATPVARPTSPPLPANVGKKSCLVATTLYRDPGHPSVVFLRDVRDRQLPATATGRRFAARLDAAYRTAAPPLAAWFTRHPRWAGAARVAVLGPFVQALRVLSRATTRSPRARSIALAAALTAIASPAIATTRALTRPRRPGRGRRPRPS